MSQALLIAVGVIRDPERGILISRRHPQAHQGGLWEFPGGRCEPGETIEQALVRELREELGIETRTSAPLIQIQHDYGDRLVILNVRSVCDWSGEPAGLEGQPVRWVKPECLQALPFPEANVPIIRALRLPAQVLITPEPGDDDNAWCERIATRLGQGIRLLQLRLKSTGRERSGRLLERVESLCRNRHCRLVVNSATPVDHRRHGHALHLTSAALMSEQAAALQGRACSASCHDEREVRQANRLGLEFVMLAPVAVTQSHYCADVLGWQGFAQLARQAQMPAYALGGMSAADLAQARVHGGQGIAAISALWQTG